MVACILLDASRTATSLLMALASTDTPQISRPLPLYAPLRAPTMCPSQFTVVYLRVLPYLSATFGTDSTIFIVFLFMGMPFGLVRPY